MPSAPAFSARPAPQQHPNSTCKPYAAWIEARINWVVARRRMSLYCSVVSSLSSLKQGWVAIRNSESKQTMHNNNLGHRGGYGNEKNRTGIKNGLAVIPATLITRAIHHRTRAIKTVHMPQTRQRPAPISSYRSLLPPLVWSPSPAASGRPVRIAVKNGHRRQPTTQASEPDSMSPSRCTIPSICN